MSPQEAKMAIESLANGLDPDTGEVLASQSIINSPRVIRALFVAVKALESAEKKDRRPRSLPDNAGRSWSEEEDQTLLASFDRGDAAKRIAAQHGRTIGAITSRLLRLGRINDRAALSGRI